MVKGYYTIDARSVLYVQSNMDMFNDFPYGLNDFTVSKRDTSSMITLHTYIDDVLLNSYWADGLIVSTPTGSTGYSLSCGGPIIFPDAANFIITPIAPHNLNVRPIVISNEKTISIRVEGRTQNFMCTLDSRYQTITDEHHITINKADFDFKFILLEGKSFINKLN